MAILGYACHLGLLETADAFLTQNPHLSAVDYELKPGPTFWEMGFRTNRLGTPFQISASLGKEDFARLFLNKGNMVVNHIRSQGLPILGSVLEFGNLPKKFQCEAVSLLLSRGADPNPSQVRGTPLQLAVASCRVNISAIEMLLNAGADVNAVADDDAFVRFLRSFYIDAYASRVIYKRGKAINYDTPLRIAEDRLNSAKSTGLIDSKHTERLTGLAKLLEKHGAKSLHLFSIKGLPGYVEEDMIAFHDTLANTIEEAS
jgi:ankyrin repeat protein